MAVKGNVWLRGLTYKGGGTMLSWLLHRIGGLAMLLFVGMHVIASFFTQQFGSGIGTTINTLYESLYFQIGLYFFVLFHTMNGLRIIALDTFPKLLEYQRELTWLQWFMFLPLYGITVYFIILRILSGG